MGFNTEKFMATQFVRREKKLSIPDLKDWFDDGEDPEWIIQNLEGNEIAIAKESSQRASKLREVISDIAATHAGVKNLGPKIKQVNQALGLIARDTPEDIALRLEYFRFGSKSPQVDLEFAIKFCRVQAIEFYFITNEIFALCGLGHEPGKQPPSGEMEKLERP